MIPSLVDQILKERTKERKLLRDYNWPCRQLAVELPSFLIQLPAARYKQTSSRYVSSCFADSLSLSLSLSLSNQPALLYTSCTVVSSPAAALDSILEEQYPPVWVEQSQSLIDLLTNILVH
jgi:hypothetical protein